MKEDRESKEPQPETADPLEEFAGTANRDVRIEGRTARATDDLDEEPKPDKNVQEPPD